MFLLALPALCPSLNSYKKSIHKAFKDTVLFTSVEIINNKNPQGKLNSIIPL
jgi:hypothetical protein